jgi:hypothetical protein
MRPGFSTGPTVDRTDDRFEYGEVRTNAIGLINGIEITSDLHRSRPERAPHHFDMEVRTS